jgi:hypothetical protein
MPDTASRAPDNDRFRRADDRADLVVEAQEGDEVGPGVLPEPYDGRIALLPFPGEFRERIEGGGLGDGGVNRLDVFRDFRPVSL